MESDVKFDKLDCQWRMSLSGEAKILEIHYSLQDGKSKLLVTATGKVDEISDLEFDAANSAYQFFSNHFEEIQVTLLICEESTTQKNHIQTYASKPVLLDDGTKHSFKNLIATLALNTQGFSTLKDFALTNKKLEFDLHIDGERLCDAFNNCFFEGSGLICDLPNFDLRMSKK